MLIQENNFDNALATLRYTEHWIALDTETDGIHKNKWSSLVGIATYCKVPNEDMFISFYFPFYHEHDPTLFGNATNLSEAHLAKLGATLESKDRKYIFHNAKYDIEVLYRAGIDLENNYFRDTMIIAHMVNENEISRALKRLGDKYIEKSSSEKQKQIKELVKHVGGWNKVPPEAMALYAEKDVELTYKLHDFFYPQLIEQEMDHLWQTEMVFNNCLRHIERNGILIKPEVAKQYVYESKARLTELQQELGFDPMKPDLLANKLYGEKPEGLGLQPVGYGKRKTKAFPKGIPVMHEAALSSVNLPVTQTVLEYRGLVKALGTYYQGFLDRVHADSRLHPTFRQDGTVTTRLSCADPNMQQIPRQKGDALNRKVKEIFDAPPGYELWEFDYSQLEFRLAACYANSEAIIDAYRQGADFHQLTAEKLGIPRDPPGANAKAFNFGTLYGAGPKKLAEMLGIPEAEAFALYQDYWAQYPELRDVISEAERAAESRGWVRLWTGRRRHFQWKSEYHKAFNSIIQGGAAEIVKRTMIDIYTLSDYKVVCQVHDALWFELPSEGIEEAKKEIIDVMEWPRDEFAISFPVDSKLLAKGE